MDLAEMEKRLRALEDIEEIKKLQVHYLNCLITCDWDELEDCFAEDGATDFLESGISRGKAALARDFRERISESHIGKEGLFTVHPIVNVDGDKATGTWLFYYLTCHPREFPDFPDPKDVPDWMQGIYDMEYVRENGKWKISLLKWRARLKSVKAAEK